MDSSPETSLLGHLGPVKLTYSSSWGKLEKHRILPTHVGNQHHFSILFLVFQCFSLPNRNPSGLPHKVTLQNQGLTYSQDLTNGSPTSALQIQSLRSPSKMKDLHFCTFDETCKTCKICKHIHATKSKTGTFWTFDETCKTCKHIHATKSKTEKNSLQN